MFLPALITTTLAVAASSTKLYVSSYTGNITTLSLTRQKNSTYNLALLSTTTGCGANATWLQLSPSRSTLYCLDEGIVLKNGSLNAFTLHNTTGLPIPSSHTPTPAAPVNSALYTSPNGTQLLILAHYAHALTIWRLHPSPNTNAFTPLQTLNLTSPPGPKPQQASPHPHQARLDPTGRYLLLPELGADLIRVFCIDPLSLTIYEHASVPVARGSGPRHGVFYTSPRTNETYYYLVSEIGNTLTGYRVRYLPSLGGVDLTLVTNGTAYGPANGTAFAFNAAAEIALYGDTLTVSNRNATAFTIANPDLKNATREIASDAMATFKISPADGTVKFGARSPAGGSYPRQFSISPEGDLVAVGLQESGRVVVYRRCRETGRLGNRVLADFEGLGEVTSVVWGGGRGAE